MFVTVLLVPLFTLAMPKKKGFQHRKAKERRLRQQRLLKLADLSCQQGQVEKSSQERQAERSSQQGQGNQSSQQDSSVEVGNVKLPSGYWNCQVTDEKIVYYRVSQLGTPEAISVSFTLSIFNDKRWAIHVYQKEVNPSKCDMLRSFPAHLNPAQIAKLLSILDKVPLCAGHPDEHFVTMIQAKKGKITSLNGEVIAYLDSSPVEINGTKYSRTIRSSNCDIIAAGKCACRTY